MLLRQKYLLKYLLKDKEEVIFYVEECDYEKFLTMAKALGCIWLYGDIIDTKTQYHSPYMVIRNDYTITSINGMVSGMFYESRKSKKYFFSQFLSGIICEFIKQDMTREYYDEMNKEIDKKREEIKNRNREISMQQVKDEGLNID